MIRLGFWLLTRASHRTIVRIGRACGWLWYHVFPYRRGLARRQLRQSFPQWPEARVRATVEANFRQTCTTFAEAGLFGQLLAADRRVVPDFFSSEGYHHVRAAKALGKGVIVITAHSGNWDLLGAVSGFLGDEICVVTREIKNPTLQRLWHGLRERFGLVVVSAKRRQGGMKTMLRALRDNKVVALVIDQNMSREKGVFVDFFGRPACTTELPALLAKRTGAAVVPAFMERWWDGHNHALIHPAVPWQAHDDPAEELSINTQRYSLIVEEHIRGRPEQWLWVHRRWKTEPQ